MDDHEDAHTGRRGRPARVTRDSRLRGPQRHYDMGKVLGNGSFGVVCEAYCRDTGETVAVKKVLQDPRYKNRELDIMKELNHPNIVLLQDSYYTEEIRGENSAPELYLNVVMDHIPDTAHRVMKTYLRASQSLPQILVKLYMYQICRALGYLHALGICHRDIKPQNLLVDTHTNVLKLCDFGSAKKFSSTGETSVSYICSRFYRAPELMLGATQYTTAIDIWSIGCVMGELLLGKPLFAGDTSVDQLVKIISVLGTPSQSQMYAMNPNYTDFRFPDVDVQMWRKVVPPAPTDAIELIEAFLRYEPNQRLKPLEALAFPYFDELRDPDTRLPSNGRLPDLFNFMPAELREMTPQTRMVVMPKHVHARQYN